MPPPQPILASKLRGFVCTSCRTKLKLQQQTRWLSRSLASQSTPGYQKGLQGNAKKSKSKSEPVFRFFEETPDGRRKEIEDDDDFMGLREIPEDPLSKEVDASIAAINKEMKGKKGGIMSRLKEMLAPLSPEEQERMLEEKIRAEIGEEALQEDELFEVPSDPNAFIIPLAAYGNIFLPDDTQSRSYRTKIAELNERIRRVWDVLPEILKKSEKSEKKEIASLCKGLWRSYVLCRRALLSEPQEIPEHTWWLLWEVFSSPAEWNVERLAHVKILAEDMKLAGRALPDPAGVLYMEAIFISGDHEHALDLWSKAEDPFDESSESFKEYWELGARMLAKVGEIDRAVQAAEISLGHSSDETDARILLPIIQSCFVSETTFAVQKAWALYQRLRFILGEQIEMKDYDAVISSFLNANETDLALSVFTDMMLTGDKMSPSQDSTTAYKRAVASGSDLRSLRIERKELGWEKSQVLAKLPQKFNNKFFFGSWMKKLIGHGELKFAEKVLDIMYERGITPDAHYLNGMIGAWLREGTAHGQQKAEEMAWRMIKARLDFVKARNQSSRSALWKPNAVSERPDHKSLILEHTPKATIETFSVLLENYRRRQKHEQLEGLYDTLREAQIRPNTFFMNQLLGADLRGGEKHWAWDKYTFLVQDQGVKPDFDTFQCLWHIMRKQVDPLVTKKDENYTNCRELFAEMVKYASILARRAQMPRELYDLILLSFGLADDQVGTAIALRGLQHSFNMYPNPTTARTVILQLSRIGRRNTAGFRPRRLKLDPATKDRIDQVTKILEAFRSQRVKALAEKGVVFDELSGEAKSEESLVLLCDLLQYVAEVRIEGSKDGSRGLYTLSHQVAEEMGMPGSIPWRAHDDGNSETRSPLSSSE